MICKFKLFIGVLALGLASLACQTIIGGSNSPSLPNIDNGGVENPLATVQPGPNKGDGITINGDSEFPMPADAINVVNAAGLLNFQTKKSLEDAMKFYRDEFGKNGYTERSGLTVQDKSTFSMVFDGHKSGQAIVVQGVDLGNGTVNINISLQDV